MQLSLADSHCHLDCVDLSQFENSFVSMLDHARAQCVAHMLCVSISMQSYPAMRRLVEPHDHIAVSVGQHPLEDGEEPASVAQLLRLADDERVVAIGETGLDYHYGRDRVQQQESFRRHLQAAQQANKPVIVHTREASKDTLRILREMEAEKIGGVMHCFAEDMAVAEQALAMNFYVSFSGIVTFRNADALRAVAREIPSARLLIETDSPYLAPVPCRGKQNHPGNLHYVAECLAAVRGWSLARLAEQTTSNYFALFFQQRTP